MKDSSQANIFVDILHIIFSSPSAAQCKGAWQQDQAECMIGVEVWNLGGLFKLELILSQCL